ncbi:MAG: RiPP maturation radical SAM C-methyltransferase [Anaerolineae bacterium]|nr:RiPP maturation radical SAM C-methyltransferase [Anaerolineae bacterium]
MFDFSPFVPASDALIIVPPFARLNAPALGVHVLQACARAAGFQVRVLYANLWLGATLGPETYTDICEAPPLSLFGERLFAASAYGLPPLGHQPEEMFDYALHLRFLPPEAQRRLMPMFDRVRSGRQPALNLPALLQVEAQAAAWVEAVAAGVAALNCPIVGCTTMFEQTAASVALLKRIKQLSPQTITIIGGPNCEGEMAQGVASLSPALDYIFSGESETTFVDFLHQIKAGQRPAERIIYGQPCQRLDALPSPDLTEFYQQFEQTLPAQASQPDYLWLSYESSRGCWWGQKHHCTFCGLNGQGMGYRAKSADRMIGDLKQLVAKHSLRQVGMTDNIMPYAYFKTLLPRLAAEIPGLQMYYALKANLSLAQMRALKEAGVVKLQPGIEALSSSLLKRMNKGVLARQNVALLRYARSLNIEVYWNLLWGFPGDQAQEYRETLNLLPLLRHLQPPSGLHHLAIDRFSPYFDRPADYGIKTIKPLGGYASLLPAGVDLAQVAYEFVADYPCESHQHPELIRAIQREVEAWQAAWQAEVELSRAVRMLTPPLLIVTREADGRYLLRDTRGLPGVEERAWLTQRQASLALVARPLAQAGDIAWALERKVGVALDGWYVPLATAEPGLLQMFEAEPEQSGLILELKLQPKESVYV